MTSATVTDKAAAYLAEGRLTVVNLSGHRIDAICRGAGAQYRLGWNPADRWWCECPATTRRCAHVTALRLVTTRQVSRS